VGSFTSTGSGSDLCDDKAEPTSARDFPEEIEARSPGACTDRDGADYGEALPSIFAAFGDDFQMPDGSLNRAALANLVFSDDGARARLNGILHPMIETRMRHQLEICRKMGTNIVVLDVPLLYEAGMEGLADEVWCVSAPQALQLERLMTRDGLSREQAESRMGSQWPLAEKERRADAVIRTDVPLEDVCNQVLRLYIGEGGALGLGAEFLSSE